MRRMHFGKLEAMYLPPESFQKHWTLNSSKTKSDEDRTGDMRDVDRVDMEVVMDRVIRGMIEN